MTKSTPRPAPRPARSRTPRTIGVLLAVALTVVGIGALCGSAGASTRHTVHRTATRQVHASVARTAKVTARATVRGRTVAITTSAKAIGRATAKATARASATAASRTAARAQAQRRAVALAKARARKVAVASAARRATASARLKARARAIAEAELAAETLSGAGTTSAAPTTGGGTGTTTTTAPPVSDGPTSGATAGTGTTAPGSPGSDAGTASTSTTSTSTTSSSCGGQTPIKADGTPWTCTFDDEFGGTSLDSTKWTAWNGYNYNSSPNTCYYDDPSHVRVGGGYLYLSATKLASPQPCWTALGWQNALYGGAVLHTQHKFSQDGGLFEARIKFAGGTGLHNAFWLMPENGTQVYPGHAEIDAAETYGALPNTVFGSTHLNGANTSSDVGTVNGCTVANWASGFHTYAIEWTAGKQITFVFDGVKCATFANWTALPGYANSTPFDQPFFMILQSMVDNGSFSPAPNASTVFPAVTQVDYVRVWK